MWFSLLSTGVKTAAAIYKNKKEAQQLESVAEKNHMARMAAGEIEFKKAVMANNQQGWNCLLYTSDAADE